MLIVGSKGFAKEILEIVNSLNDGSDLAFYDDVNIDNKELLYNCFEIINNLNDAKLYLGSTNNKFTLGLGNPVLRKKMCDVFEGIGGKLTSTISNNAIIGHYDVKIKDGTNVLAGAILSNSTIIGRGCIIYYNAIITHDCIVEDFVEISPGATLLGRCKIGSYTQLGANCTILPDVIVGSNVIIGAGAVVISDIPDNSIVVGVPGKIIKQQKSLNFE